MNFGKKLFKFNFLPQYLKCLYPSGTNRTPSGFVLTLGKIMIIPVIQFNFLESITLRDRRKLKLFLVRLFTKEGRSLAALQYIFCSDEYLLAINRQYLNHDYYTDIITFDLSDKNHLINAEIYISVDRLRENAPKYDNSLSKELHRVMFHGALHLCGYKDKTAQEQEKMRKMEEKYLRLYTRST